MPAAVSAAAGSVNDGAITAASRGRRFAKSENPSVAPAEQKDVLVVPAVAGGDGRRCRVLVGTTRVSTEVAEASGQPVDQPLRRGRVADVDGKVEHSGHRRLVPVVARRPRELSQGTMYG